MRKYVNFFLKNDIYNQLINDIEITILFLILILKFDN